MMMVLVAVFMHCTLKMFGDCTISPMIQNTTPAKTWQSTSAITLLHRLEHNLEQLLMHEFNLLSNLSSSWQVALLLLRLGWLVGQTLHCLMVLLPHSAHSTSQCRGR